MSRKKPQFAVIDTSDDTIISRHVTMKRAKQWAKSAKSYDIPAVIRPIKQEEQKC